MSLGPTFRYDPFTGEHVLLSPARASKPDGDGGALPSPPGPCPFCPGQERADDEIARFPSEGPWQVRALANRYPAVTPRAPDTPEGKGARGSHEVIVEGRAHIGDLADAPSSLRRTVLRAYRARVGALEAGAGYVHLFRNRGLRAGASQPHPHAQILATEHVPEGTLRRWRRAEDFYATHGRTLLHEVLDDELADGRRVLHDTPPFVALCPNAPRFNGETWIAPRPSTPFSRLDDAHIDALADLLGVLLPAVLALGRRSYNLVLRQPPVAHRDDPAAFWTLAICPRGGAGAGYELSSESALVTLAPEVAAERIRRRLGTA